MNDILRFLRFHGALTPERPTKVIWRRLADVAAQLRLPDLVPSRTLKATLDIDAIHRTLKRGAVDHLFAFTTAANRWAFFEPDPAIHVIVPKRTVGMVADRIGHAADGAHDGTHTVHLYEDDLGSLDAETLNGTPFTSRLQTWLDLQYFPHAGAHAAFFEQVVQGMRERERGA